MMKFGKIRQRPLLLAFFLFAVPEEAAEAAAGGGAAGSFLFHQHPATSATTKRGTASCSIRRRQERLLVQLPGDPTVRCVSSSLPAEGAEVADSNAGEDCGDTTGSSKSTRRFDSALVSAASAKLVWEELDAAARKPILNLSAIRHDGHAPPPPSSQQRDAAADDCWDRGQRWEVTLGRLEDLGIANAEEAPRLLEACPQLLRLDPDEVADTAGWIAEEFGTAQASIIVEEAPRLLSFRRCDVDYGLDFVSMMLMMTNKPDGVGRVNSACAAAPGLLLAGAEGGIQERAVKNALGAAADSTAKANQRIAGDAVGSLRQLRNPRKGL